ncbi:MAG TPA: head GIN domain-containing protein [Anaerolineales bacterium]|nr:head GIN domain-containing protein [Anaerolineales bacterium]
MKHRSFFWPLALIATGVIWLLVSMNVIPEANLWALTYIWPYLLIALGLGLILRGYLRTAEWIVSLLIILGAVGAIVFAPQLGWAGGPDWNLFSDWNPASDFGGGVSGSGRIDSETRRVKDFLAVTIRYPAEIVIQQGKSESVKIEAEDNLLPQLSTEVRDGTLVIENKEDNWSKRVDPSKKVIITITVIDLNEINFTSAGTLRVDGLKTETLNLSLSGAGEITLNDLDVEKLESRLSGTGNIEANGTADELELTISGAGNFDAPGLASNAANVRISGVGNATVRVKDKLVATVSGAGSVDYYGSPSVDKNISGAGSVQQVDE